MFALGAAMAAYEWRRIFGTQPGEPQCSRHQSTANTYSIHLCCHLCHHLRSRGMGPRDYGQTGVLAMAAAVGATDIDPFVINIAQGGVSGLSVTTLAAAVLIAASSNNIAKAIYALGFGGVKSSRRAAWMLFVLAILGFAAAAAVHILPLT